MTKQSNYNVLISTMTAGALGALLGSAATIALADKDTRENISDGLGKTRDTAKSFTQAVIKKAGTFRKNVSDDLVS